MEEIARCMQLRDTGFNLGELRWILLHRFESVVVLGLNHYAWARIAAEVICSLTLTALELMHTCCRSSSAFQYDAVASQ